MGPPSEASVQVRVTERFVYGGSSICGFPATGERRMLSRSSGAGPQPKSMRAVPESNNDRVLVMVGGIDSSSSIHQCKDGSPAEPWKFNACGVRATCA